MKQEQIDLATYEKNNTGWSVRSAGGWPPPPAASKVRPPRPRYSARGQRSTQVLHEAAQLQAHLHHRALL